MTLQRLPIAKSFKLRCRTAERGFSWGTDSHTQTCTPADPRAGSVSVSITSWTLGETEELKS